MSADDRSFLEELENDRPDKEWFMGRNAFGQRPDISLEAKGFMYYLKTLPPGWRLSMKNVYSFFGSHAAKTANRPRLDEAVKRVGVMRLRRIFKELEDKQCMGRAAIRRRDGTFWGWAYVWSDAGTLTPEVVAKWSAKVQAEFLKRDQDDKDDL